jgi:thymidine phosphorylase
MPPRVESDVTPPAHDFAPSQLLERVRDGRPLEDASLRAFVAGIASGDVSDAQLGAFAMAVCLEGLDDHSTQTLTLAMRDSGERLDWRALNLSGPVLDKHSTGGVGDLTSLVLAPMLAACGAFLPLLSGHGLGHTGGTLDKLEALPGVRTRLDTGELQDVVRRAGLAVASAGDRMAPADARLYAVRDLTGTVASIPLITASILAKKLAAGSEVLLLDVKCGNGAFLADPLHARQLAQSLVTTAEAAGLPTTAWLTDMSQPLVEDIGNALELKVALDYLRGDRRPERLHALCLHLGTSLLCRSGLARSTIEAQDRLNMSLRSGAAAEHFASMVRLQGGPPDVFARDVRMLPIAPQQRALIAQHSGFVVAVDTRALGLAVVALGGGRRRPGEAIDPRVGLTALRGLGERVSMGEPLLIVHAANAASAERACSCLRTAFTLSDCRLPPPPLVLGQLTAGGWYPA